MSLVSHIIGQLVHDYQVHALENDRDSRIVVPGLTALMSREIHEYLIKKDVRSYLVISDDLSPSESSSWIRPVGLTSERIGSFVAIVFPGQLANLQDSIRGSGGAIRSAAFSEEWPWIDNGNESFRFDGSFLVKLVSKWTDNIEHRQWLYDFVIKCLLPDSRSSSERKTLLLEKILGQFDPALYTEITDVRLKLLFHSGIPCPPSENVPPVENLMRSANVLCKRVIDKTRTEENTRQQALEIIANTIPNGEVEIACNALNTLMDGIGQSNTLELGTLAFFSCWAGNYLYWSTLDSLRIEKIFEIESRKKAEVTCLLDCKRSIISRAGNAMATFHGEKINFSGTFKLPSENFSQHNWTLQLTYRRSLLYTEDLINPKGDYSFNISTGDAFGSYRSALPLKLSIHSDDEIRAEARIRIHLCGAERPSFIVIEPGFYVVDASYPDEDELIDKKIESNDPAHLYMFCDDCPEPKYLDFDENELSIIEMGMPGIWRSSEMVDPLEDASGQVTRICQFDGTRTVVCFEAKDVIRGQFTLEDELRVQIAGPRDSNLQELISLFREDSNEPYRRLGKVNDQSRRRTLLANDLTSEGGWRPLVVNLLSSNLGNADLIGNYIASRGRVVAPGFNNLSMPQPAVDLLGEYRASRYQLIETILDALRHTDIKQEHPVYSTHPVFLHSESDIRENQLRAYLHAYQKVLAYVNQQQPELEWSQLFALVYLDCVVHWDETSLRNSFILAGPWHPLVLAKRYMVQAALFRRADKLTHREGKSFRQLVNLLKQTEGFMWLPGLHRNDRILEPLKAGPTSDPGWHLAIKQDLATIVTQSDLGSLTVLLDQINDNLGLESHLFQGYTEDIAVSSVVNFMRAYPSRRSIGIHLKRGYSANEIMFSLENLLHEEDGPSIEGGQVPGGIHLYTEDKLEGVERIHRTDPPILMYNMESNQARSSDINSDMIFITPSIEPAFRPADEQIVMPRGEGYHAVFGEPISWLTEGQEQTPNSITLDFDVPTPEGTGLGHAFVEACSRVCSILHNRVAMVRSVQLPHSINSQWAIVPGGNLDPAIFVKYVRDGISRQMENRALWDYRLDISESKNTYYILSTIPETFAAAVSGFFHGIDVANQFINDLGAHGVAIGGEALKSGRHALGVVGLVGTMRILKGRGEEGLGIFHDNDRSVGFLIPVDSFNSFFSDRSSGSEPDENAKKTDLLAVQLGLSNDDQITLNISAAGVESKFVSRTFCQSRAIGALQQAKASLERFRKLVEVSKNDWAIAERLGLIAIVRFGLRIASQARKEGPLEWMGIEQKIISAILHNRFNYLPARQDAIVVTTEGQLVGTPEINTLSEGTWIRINREHWPGVNDTLQLAQIGSELSGFFEISWGTQESNELEEERVELTGEIDATETTTETPPSELLGEDGSLQETDSEHEINDEIIDTGEELLAPEDEQPEAGQVEPLARILLGVTESRRPVFLDPQSPLDPLDNLNLMITGSSGTGKTQLLKYLICKVREQGKNSIILDFKNDFAADRVFQNVANLQTAYVNFDGLPFNPLIPFPVAHPATGELVIQAGQHITGVAAVLKRTYGLGAQQQISVKNAITEAFSSYGIQASGTAEYDPNIRYPDFNTIGAMLSEENPGAYNRLDPLFTLDLFRSEYCDQSFLTLVNRSLVLDLSSISSDQIKNALAELVILSAHAYYNSQPHSGTIRQFLIFDEAHRVLNSEFMANIVRECRAYGVGTILSSQYPSDFPPEISSSMATKILHGNGRDADRVRSISQMIGLSGKEGEVSNLDRFQAFVDNRHSPHTLVRTMNYPLHLAYSLIMQQGQATRDELASLEGIDTEKLPINNLVMQMERIGLVEEREGAILPLRSNE